MPNTKGTDIVNLKSIFTKEAQDLEQTFLSKLSESDQKIYQNTIATSWIDIDASARLVQAAAEIFFPGKQDACLQLAQKLAEKAYSGVYSVFLQIPKTSYIIKRAANVWKSYHDTGTATVENQTNNSSDFVVRNYPGLPKVLRETTMGHIMILLGKTGSKNIRVKLNDSNPQEWVWHVTWD